MARFKAARTLAVLASAVALGCASASAQTTTPLVTTTPGFSGSTNATGGVIEVSVDTPQNLVGNVTISVNFTANTSGADRNFGFSIDGRFIGTLLNDNPNDDPFDDGRASDEGINCDGPFEVAIIPASQIADLAVDGQLVLTFDASDTLSPDCPGTGLNGTIELTGNDNIPTTPQDRTNDAVAGLGATRIKEVLTNTPNLADRLDGGKGPLLVGSGTGTEGNLAFSGSFSGFAQTMRDRRSASEDGGPSFPADREYGSANIPAVRGARAVGSFDGWVAVTGSYFDFDQDNGGLDGDGFSVVGRFGLDYKPHSTVLLGLYAQVDYTQHDATQGLELDGVGFLAGPYFVYRPFQTITVEGLAAGGVAYNNLDETTGESDYDSNRLLLTTRVSGRYSYGPWTIQPSVRVSYAAETQEGFNSSSGAFIEEQTIGLGEVRFGPEIGRQFAVGGDGAITPWVRVEGVAPFASTGSLASGATVLNEDFSATGVIGLDATLFGATLSASAKYDGAFDDEFQSVTGLVSLSVPLN